LRKIKSLWELIVESLEDYILRVLILAATCSLVIGVVQHGWTAGWVEGVAIFIAVGVIVSVTAGNNYVKEKQFQKLFQKANEDFTVVFRGNEGGTQTIPFTELLVGDVIQIESGMKVPADCIILSGTDLSADEAALTGEPEHVEKSDVNENNVAYNPSPFILSNTLIATGSGTALVCAVGTNTRSG
jgi:Ca2+ transporting ATPase